MSEINNAAKGCGGIFGFFVLVIGSLMLLKGGDEAGASTDVADADAISVQTEAMAIRSDADKATLQSNAVGANVDMAELPPMDGADKMIGAAINLQGHLCARPIEVREVGTQYYAVRCITRRDGTGVSGYFVNTRTNEVEPF